MALYNLMYYNEINFEPRYSGSRFGAGGTPKIGGLTIALCEMRKSDMKLREGYCFNLDLY